MKPETAPFMPAGGGPPSDGRHDAEPSRKVSYFFSSVSASDRTLSTTVFIASGSDTLLAALSASLRIAIASFVAPLASSAVATALDANGATKEAIAILKEADKAANKVSEPDAMKTVVDKVRSLALTLEKK